MRSTPTTRPQRRAAPAGLMAALAIAVAVAGTARSQTQPWEHAPYRIHVLMAVDAPGSLQRQLEASLPAYIHERVDSAVGPIWSLEIELAEGTQRTALLAGNSAASFEIPILTTLDSQPSTLNSPPVDKWMLVAVRSDGSAFRLRAREFDTYVERWSVVITDRCDQYAMLAERVFQLMRRTFAPLAQLRLDPEDENRVLLDPRGTEVASKDPDACGIEPGAVLLPILRRATRDGELIEGGMQAVPWTYVVAEETEIDGDAIVAQIYSGTRRPFGVRRRGRVEQLAIVLRGEPAPLDVRLVSQTDPEKPLVGYEIFLQDIDDDAITPAGVTDRQGHLTVPPGDTRVRQLIVKNGGQLLARMPVVPGTVAELEVPLPDDDTRLQAESALWALRENLVDVVAQRTILAARARRQIEAGRLDEADRLLDQLDDLPGGGEFQRRLKQLQRQFTVNDPAVRRRIERMFSDTESILGHFLDPGPINRLHDDLGAARDAGG